MILDRMQISGFLSYNDRVEINFSGFTLACISGANGAGKSSLLEAITWVLFGEARRRDDAIINLRSKTADVVLDFHYEGVHYQVQRSKTRDKSTILEFRMRSPEGDWRILTEPSMRNTEDMIRRTLHLDYETFINASFFLQGKADQFAQQRPGDRKRILSGILGLDIWESYREEAARRRKNFEGELALINSHLQDIENELLEEEARKSRLAQLLQEVDQKNRLLAALKVNLDQQRLQADRVESDRRQVEKQHTEVKRLQEELDRSRDELTERCREREIYKQQLENEEETVREAAEWEAARLSLAEWDKIASNFHQFELQRQSPALEIERARTRLQAEMDSLAQKQHDIRELESSLPALQQQLEQYNESINAANELLSRRSQLETEKEHLVSERARLGAENQRLRVEMNEIRDHIANLGEITGATCPTCEKPLTADELQRLVGDLGRRGKEMGDAHRANEKMIDDYKERAAQIEKELLDLQRVDADLRSNQRQFDARSEELRLSRATITDWHEKDERRMQEISQLLATGSYAEEAHREIATIDAQLKQLGYDTTAHEQVRQAEMEGRASQEKLQLLKQARASLLPLEREIDSLEKSLDKSEKHLATLREDLHQAEEKLRRESASLPDMVLLQAEYDNALEDVNKANTDLGYAKSNVDILEKQRKQKVLKLEEKDSLVEKISNLKILERAFGKDGIPALLIEQALPYIESHANEILDRLSAGGMSVKFETQRDFKDKKRDDRRETLDILIRDSSGERPYEMFSGGEAFRVNFAIRLALSRVLAHRAGARLQTLVIDEGFGSQDADGRQRLVEAINLVGAEFEKILVITHLEELKDAFPARIEVTKAPGGSQVQVVVA